MGAVQLKQLCSLHKYLNQYGITLYQSVGHIGDQMVLRFTLTDSCSLDGVPVWFGIRAHTLGERGGSCLREPQI